MLLLVEIGKAGYVSCWLIRGMNSSFLQASVFDWYGRSNSMPDTRGFKVIPKMAQRWKRKMLVSHWEQRGSYSCTWCGRKKKREVLPTRTLWWQAHWALRVKPLWWTVAHCPTWMKWSVPVFLNMRRQKWFRGCNGIFSGHSEEK